MVAIVKRTGAGALLLMIIPLLLWVNDWQWRPESDYRWLKWWYWLTKTVTPPCGTLISALLIGWFLWCLCYSQKAALGLAVILFVMLLIGQSMKSFIKKWVQEPRPYIVWLGKHYVFNDRVFYAMSHKECAVALARVLQQQQLIPLWLQHHWCSEISFSFPSGHTVFAVSWALLAVGLLWPRQHRASTIVLMAWASGVMISRIALGMHWPCDVLMGIAVGWLVITLTCWLVQLLDRCNYSNTGRKQDIRLRNE